MFDACECELDGHQNCYDDMSKNQHSFYIDSVLNEMFCDDDEGTFQFYTTSSKFIAYALKSNKYLQLKMASVHTWTQ